MTEENPHVGHFAKMQFRQAKGPQMIDCECGRMIPIRFMYRCYYCGLWLCDPCAENHFGKSREQYLKEKLQGIQSSCQHFDIDNLTNQISNANGTTLPKFIGYKGHERTMEEFETFMRGGRKM